MADVKWIKITTDIFDDEKILMLESMPSADSIIVIWFKLLTFAGKQNNDGVFLMSNRIAYTDEMLASIFRRDVNTVRLALNAFEQFGMIEIVDNVITIPNWGKHQSLDAYEKKKAYDRKYRMQQREKQRLLVGQSNDSRTDSRTTVVVPEEDKDKERDIEEDKDNDVSYNDTFKASLSEIISYLNEKTESMYKASTKKTQSCIKARLSEGFTVDDFKTVIDKKCAEWLGDEKMAKYLRPETLFGSKFEGYLNAKTTGRTNANGQATGDSSKVRIGHYV